MKTKIAYYDDQGKLLRGKCYLCKKWKVSEELNEVSVGRNGLRYVCADCFAAMRMVEPK